MVRRLQELLSIETFEKRERSVEFSAIRRETLETQVYEALRKAIIEGRLARDARLVQDDLASQFGTSRIPVRDALKRLEAEGLVNLDERGSYVVSCFGSEDIEEIYGLRLLLEPYAASKALDRATPGDLEDLGSIVQEMQEAAAQKDIERYVQLNQTFHFALYDLSGQRRLVRMIQSLWSGLMPLTPMAVPGQLERSASEHELLMRALKERRRDSVEALMRDHIEHARKALQAHLAAEGRSKGCDGQDIR
jgi:DNA-binding GntR family transcriptional regulator